MSSSLHSKLRTTLLVGLAGALGLSAISGLSGCKDEIDPPTLGTISINFAGNAAGAFEDGVLYKDGTQLTTVSEAFWSDRFSPGVYTFRYEKDCTDVSPSPEVVVDLAAGDDVTIDWYVAVQGGLEITSSIPGANIYINGQDSGLTTPTTLECLDPTTMTVRVDLLGAMTEGAAEQTVEIGPGLARTDFTLEPLPQKRGALMEVLTATECPNCLPVDNAAETLWESAELVAAGVTSLQIHHPWAQGVDPYHTQETWDRNSFYGAGDGSAGHPIRYTNGILRVQGAGDGNEERIAGDMEAEASQFLDQDALFAIHWIDITRTPGEKVVGHARIFATDDVANPDITEVLGMVYKDRLQTRVRIHQNALETFFRVVRKIESAGTCSDLGLLHRGDYADVEFNFDISWDTTWSEDLMGAVILVQETAWQQGEREVFNVRHITVE
ncbi:MAG: PEGA domain-containing protein [Candidatus Eisenbacteria bacterium]